MISVVVLTYNRSRLLNKCLLSVFNQTYKDFEVIIVDDGSTDDTKKMVECLNNGKIVYFNEGKIGNVSKLRNIGIKISKGEYIAFCDDDDIWMEKKLEMQSKYLDNEKVVCSIGNVIDENDQVIFEGVNLFEHDYVDLELLLKGDCILTSSVILKKNIFEEVGYFDETDDKSEDFDLWLRVLEKYKIKFINEKLISYRLGIDNTTTRSYSQKKLFSLRNIKLISPYLKSKNKNILESAKIGIGLEYKNLTKYCYKERDFEKSKYYCKKLLQLYHNKLSLKYVKFLFFFICIVSIATLKKIKN